MFPQAHPPTHPPTPWWTPGIVLWEICVGEMPVRGCMRNPEVPTECPQDLLELIDACTQVGGWWVGGAHIIASPLPAPKASWVGGQRVREGRQTKLSEGYPQQGPA